MNDLAQYFTPQPAGHLLVRSMATEHAEAIVDIGVGGGELLRAAKHRWSEARIYAADIDKRYVIGALQHFPGEVCLHLNALHLKLPAKLGLGEGCADVAVCNPPYLAANDLPGIAKMLRAANLADCVSPKRVTTDIVFIAQNLRLLRNGGELAVIVPDGLATHTHFADLRQALCERHGLYRAIQLPDRFFAGTEARTHIFYLRKNTPPVDKIHLSGATRKGLLDGETNISLADARERLDYSFHAQSFQIVPMLRLGDLEVEILRGAFTHRECQEKGFPYFHTTDFKRFSDCAVNYPVLDLPERWTAQPGDLLLPRVGARCLHYAAKVVSGNPILTDCVYRLRVAPPWREPVWKALTSLHGVNWRIQAAHGVCARVLSKAQLLDFPLQQHRQ